MLFRPSRSEFRVVATACSRAVTASGFAMLVPAFVAVVLGEDNEAWGFLLGAAVAVLTGSLAAVAFRTRAPLTTGRLLASAGVGWFVVPVFAAVPLLLSGHYATPLDAYFEAVSGLVAGGLTMVNDVDHMARSTNLWRHLLELFGALAVIILALEVVSVGPGGSVRLGTLIPGEAEEDRAVPNLYVTSRLVVRTAVVYALLGTLALWAVLLAGGFAVSSALYHAVNLFLSSYSTGAFTTQSTSLAFYRSPLVEAVAVVLMVAGAFGFVLHQSMSFRRRRALFQHIETRTAFLSVVGLFTILTVGLARTETFLDGRLLLRHGFFQLISAHTTTGLMTVPWRFVVVDWGVLAPAMLVAAMAIGGMAGSAAGGIKVIRVGLILKGLRRDVRRVLLPENAVIVETFHATVRRILTSKQVLAAATLFLLYLLLYLAGALIPLFYGYELRLALFESTAAASTSGLPVGLVRPALEWPLKVVFLVQMVVGRLEFIAVFTFVGYLFASVRGRA